MKRNILSAMLLVAMSVPVWAQTPEQALLSAQLAYQKADGQLDAARRQKAQAADAQRLAAQRLMQAQQAAAQADLALQNADSALLSAENSMRQAESVLKDAWQSKEGVVR